MIELMLMQHTGPQAYFRKADEYLALYPDDYQTIGRLSSNQWHQRNDFRAAEALSRRALKPQNERFSSVRYSLGIMLLGQERYDAAQTEFRLAREAGFVGAGELYALLHEARGQYAEADKTYFASTAGRNGWRGETGAIVWIDRGQPAQAAAAVRDWAQKADASGDVLELLRAHAALASMGNLIGALHLDSDTQNVSAHTAVQSREAKPQAEATSQDVYPQNEIATSAPAGK